MSVQGTAAAFRLDLASLPTLPPLEEVSLTTFSVETVSLAMQLLRASPTIRLMEVILAPDPDVNAPALVRLIEELATLGVSVGLRQLTFTVDPGLNFGCEMPRAAQLGWLDIIGLPGLDAVHTPSHD